MISFFSYFPILLSLSLSFLLHTFNFKKHIHSLYGHATTFSSNNNTTDDKLRQHSISSATNDLMVCTRSIGLEISIDERIEDVDDQIDEDANNSSDCWRAVEEEGRGNWRKAEMSFPPPLSSLDGNGQLSFILSPVRKNGRLQLRRVRIKRPEVIYATRQDGRLRLFLVPNQCVLDDDDYDVEQQECEDQEVLEEEDIIKVEPGEEEVVEVDSEEEEETVEEGTSRYRCEYDKEDNRVRKLKGGDNERFRRCYELVNHIHCINHVHSQHNLRVFGLSIA